MVVLLFGFNSMHLAMDDLHSHLDATERTASQQQKSLKELAQLSRHAKTSIEELSSKVKENEDGLGRQRQELGQLRGELGRHASVLDEHGRRVAEVDKVKGDHQASVEELHAALQEERQKAEKSAAKLAEIQEYMKNLMFQQSESQRVQRDLQTDVTNLTQTLAQLASRRVAAVAQVPPPIESPGVVLAEEKGTVEEEKPSSGDGVEASSGGDDEAKEDATTKRVANLPAVAAASTESETDAEVAAGGDDETAGDAKEDATTTAPPAAESRPHYRVAWYRECGCTGMEIEAVTLLVALVARIGATNVRTNSCNEACAWPKETKAVLSQIEVKHESMLWPRTQAQWPQPGGKYVLVVHAAFEGVCALPGGLELAQRSEDERSRERSGGLFRVSRSMMETDRLNADAVTRCNDQFDAIWVPSSFNFRSFSEASVNKDLLHVLPEAVDTDLFSCKIADDDLAPAPIPSFGLPKLDDFMLTANDPGTFTFLSVFKWESRKNWQMLLKTFWQTFPQASTVVALANGSKVDVRARLLIKTQQLSWGTDVYEDVNDLLRSLGMSWEQVKDRMTIVIESLPTELMPSLYRAADAFVLPTHGEGWCLPLAEAMSSGLPTIATGWGGQTEFMTSANSWPIGYKLKDADIGAGGEEIWGGPPPARHKWAVPDKGELRQAMLEVVHRSPAVRAKAAQGCEDIRRQFNQASVAASTDALLAGLGGVAKTA
mmetsp:Transcript_7748/g.23250  ORF Transcript_7748/g.23250 Transcript_7748/m.23250 type:complete len:717 (-) Transcript_7748:129-2279(-)